VAGRAPGDRPGDEGPRTSPPARIIVVMPSPIGTVPSPGGAPPNPPSTTPANVVFMRHLLISADPRGAPETMFRPARMEDVLARADWTGHRRSAATDHVRDGPLPHCVTDRICGCGRHFTRRRRPSHAVAARRPRTFAADHRDRSLRRRHRWRLSMEGSDRHWTTRIRLSRDGLQHRVTSTFRRLSLSDGGFVPPRAAALFKEAS